MQLNWRAHAAKIQLYYEQGESVTHKLRQFVYTMVALKLLGLPIWAIVAGSPVLVSAYLAIGYIWINHGWYRQNTEVAALHTWSPINIWQMNALAKVLDRVFPQGVEVDALNLDPRIAAGLSSMKD